MKQQNRKNKEQKTPLIFRIGLILMCAMMISCYMMSGLYAKYTSNITGSGSAKVAKFDCEVNYLTNGYGGANMQLYDKSIYAVIEEFQVINSGEVSLKYDMDVKLALYSATATFDSNTPAPSYCTLNVPENFDTNQLYHIRHVSLDTTDGEVVSAQWENILSTKLHTDEETNNISTINGFVTGNIYYGVSDDGKAYTWNFLTNSSELFLTGELKSSEAYYYKILYFIDYRNVVDFDMEDIELSLVYKMQCSQID